jgi:hypothetical protein
MGHRSISEVYRMAPVFIFILDITGAFEKIKIKMIGFMICV